MKTAMLFLTVILNALSTGFFFAWSVSVVLGMKKVGDYSYLETMQNINREILNPLFFVVFFGSFLGLIISGIFQYDDKTVFCFVLTSAIIYLIGVVGVTAFGNVPLNDELEILDLRDLDLYKLKTFRNYFESNWNLYHRVRTIASILSFAIFLLGIWIQNKS